MELISRHFLYEILTLPYIYCRMSVNRGYPCFGLAAIFGGKLNSVQIIQKSSTRNTILVSIIVFKIERGIPGEWPICLRSCMSEVGNLYYHEAPIWALDPYHQHIQINANIVHPHLCAKQGQIKSSEMHVTLVPTFINHLFLLKQNKRAKQSTLP